MRQHVLLPCPLTFGPKLFFPSHFSLRRPHYLNAEPAWQTFAGEGKGAREEGGRPLSFLARPSRFSRAQNPLYFPRSNACHAGY